MGDSASSLSKAERDTLASKVQPCIKRDWKTGVVCGKPGRLRAAWPEWVVLCDACAAK